MKKQLFFIVVSSIFLCNINAQVVPTDIENPVSPLPQNVHYYKDLDGDTYGDIDTEIESSNGMPPSLDSNWVQNGLDCDDTDANVFPGQGCDDLQLSNENYIHEITYTSSDTEEELSHLVIDSEVSSDVLSASTSIILKPGFRTNGNVIIKIDPNSKIGQPATTRETVTYFNGLGKPVQEIAIQASPNGKDIIRHIEYDAFGRTAQQYLPFASNQTTGALLPNARASTISYYQNEFGDAKPYTETIFDSSPINQISEEVGIGQDFTQSNGRTHKTIIETNNQTDKRVKKFEVQDTNGHYQLQPSFSYYENGTLLVQTLKDPNWQPEEGKKGTSETYKDKNGRLVLERVFDDAENELNTYYIYDPLGNLIFVIPPIAETILFSLENTVNQQTLYNFCYQYRYDNWNRLIEKKLPGKQWEYIVYDSHARPILSQDGSLRANNLWAFSKYDVYGRDIYSGLYTSSSNRATLQTTVDNFTNSQNPNNSEERSTGTTTIGQVALNYDNTAFPTTGITEVLAVNYYDDFDFTDADKPAIPDTVEGQTVTQRTNGLHTASWVKTLGRNSWAKNYFYYDEKAREIKIISKNHLGGITEIASELDFRGNLLKATTTHKKVADATPIVIIDEFSYDPQERLLQHQQQINDLPVESIAQYEYDALGTQTQKKVGGHTTSLQTIDYSYNIQGALKAVNSVQSLLSNSADNDLFAYKLNYHNAVEGTSSTKALYNGGISQNIWRSAIADEKQSYAYRFDKLNRLIAADYSSGSILADDTEKFKLEGLTYDAAGNIKTLQRTGTDGTIDDLNFDHSDSDGNETNLLYNCTDNSGNTEGYTDTHPSGDNYSYDNEGRLIADQNKGITHIQYNYLDLPDRIEFADGNRIEIVYDATGNKLEKIYTTNNGNTSTLYLSGFQYQDDQLLFFAQPEGYVIASDSEARLSADTTIPNYEYVYVYSDHLGNNRLSYSDTNGDDFISIDEIQSASNYYPMGMLHSGELVTDSYYNYKFQGKELQTENGIYQYDFGSRIYDPSIGRWFVIDPQAESFYGVSPYMAMGNNPVMMVDPDGEFVITLTAVLMGAAFGSLSGAIMASEAGLDHREGLWKGALAGAAGGALSQIVTPGVGALSGAKAGAINSASAAFGSSFTGSFINGENIGDSFINGLKGGAIGGGIGGLFGGLSGGGRAGKIGLDFWKGDKIVDEIKFNELFDELDLACTDCNFMKGERLSDFKADLTADDAGSQVIRAFKKAKVYELKKIQVKMDDIFDYSNEKSYAVHGWNNRDVDGAFTRSFKFEKTIFKAYVPSSFSRNVHTSGVGTRTNPGSFDIRLFKAGHHGSTYLSKLQFTGYNNGARKILNHINGRID